MKTVEIHGLTVQGLRVRTCNADEMQPETARIGPLWANFASQIAPHMAPGAQAYGVYHHYESDVHGAFDVLAGASALRPQLGAASTLACVDMASGLYLVFDASGKPPQAVVEAWETVWRYFADASCPYRRMYTTDFERYGPNGEIEVFIAVVPS